MGKKAVVGYLVVAVLFTVIASFQNCGPVQFSQNSSNPNQQQTTQGCFGCNSDTQVFNFGASSNKVDILIVDDNSPSMDDEQNNMATRFSSFISSLNNIDWQVAVTTTDVECVGTQPSNFCGHAMIDGAKGQFIGPINSTPTYSNSYILSPTTPNVAQVFANTIQRNGQTGSGDERAIYAANLAVDHRNDYTAGFFRGGASFVVVILSDEDERSTGGTLDPNDQQEYQPLENYDEPDTLINKVYNTWNGQKSLLVDAIIIKPDDNACEAVQDNNKNFHYHEGFVYSHLVKSTGGMMGSVCDNGAGSFSNDLANISQSIATTTSNPVINLQHVPSSAPQLTFQPAANAVAYTWATGSQVIRLASYPANTQITVTYNY